MPNVPLDTRFIGIAPQVNLTERKSAVLNAETQPYTIQDIANAAGGNGSSIFQPEVLLYSGTTLAGIAVSTAEYCPIFLASKQISAPNLLNVGTSIILYDDSSVNYMYSQLESISMPLLETIGLDVKSGSSNYIGIEVYGFRYLQSVDFSSLREISNCSYPVYIVGCGEYAEVPFTTIDLSSLQTISNTLYSFQIVDCPTLEVIDISGLTSSDVSNYFFQNNALTESTVDAILYQLAVVLELSDKTVALAGGTNAAPSVTGQDYVDILIANGCTVSTN